MFKRLLQDKRLRFLAIGGFNTVVGYSLFALFYMLLGHGYYLLAYVLSYLVALVSGFTLQRTIVFKAKGHLLLDFLRYTLVQLGAFGANLVLLPLLVEGAHLHPLLAQAIALVVTVVASYFAHRYFSFHRKKSVEDNNS